MLLTENGWDFATLSHQGLNVWYVVCYILDNYKYVQNVLFWYLLAPFQVLFSHHFCGEQSRFSSLGALRFLVCWVLEYDTPELFRMCERGHCYRKLYIYIEISFLLLCIFSPTPLRFGLASVSLRETMVARVLLSSCNWPVSYASVTS